MASSSTKPFSRYSSFDTRSSTSSRLSDPSSSVDLKKSSTKPPLTRLTRGDHRRKLPDLGPSSAAHDASSLPVAKATNKKPQQHNFGAMVKKFVETRSKPKTKAPAGLYIPADFIAEDLKKPAKKGTSFATNLHRKFFSKGSGSGSGSSKGSDKKALADVKANTRTLAMVLRSERELLNQNKDLQDDITRLNLMLEQKNHEVEKLKDLCLKQRAEIKALRSALLFPDEMNSQLHELIEKQGSELKQANQIIPSLQKQVSSLTGQLQCLAEGLAEVKGDKKSLQGCFDDHAGSPKTPAYDREAANSLEFSSGDPTTPGSPDDMFLEDLNPCLTPHNAYTKSKEHVQRGYSLRDERLSESNSERYNANMSRRSSNYYLSSQGRTSRVPCRYV